MRRALISLALALPALSACGGSGGADSKVTETRMDDIDSVEGTISDEMVPTDENAELAPVEAEPVTAKPKDSKAKDDEGDKPAPAPAAEKDADE